MKTTARLSRWHRRLGLVLCLFAVLLATTGIALNHAPELQLTQRTLQWPWLLRLYGMPSNTPQQTYAVRQPHILQTHWISRWHDGIYFDTQRVGVPPPGQLHGAVALITGFAIASDDSVWLLDEQAQVVDRLDRPDSSAIVAIGIAQQQLQLRLADGSQWQANEDLTAFARASEMADTQWAVQASLPESLLSAIAQQAGGITVERLLLDLHSGRLFTRVGRWVMDFAGVALMALAFTGLWMVLRRWRRHPKVGKSS